MSNGGELVGGGVVVTDERSIFVKCGQAGCDARAGWRYTWPGRDESTVCVEHVAKLLAIANALGMHLQVVHIPRHMMTCRHFEPGEICDNCGSLPGCP